MPRDIALLPHHKTCDQEARIRRISSYERQYGKVIIKKGGSHD
jgi:hypothetical protein